MKLKHRSIRFKFFAAISIIALVFIGILVLLNVFFYQDYYMMTRRSELRDAYGSICTSWAGTLNICCRLICSASEKPNSSAASAAPTGLYLPSASITTTI